MREQNQSNQWSAPWGFALALICGSAILSGCTPALRGGDADLAVHFDATYAMARAAGFDPRSARKIATADAYTDEHPDTTSVATERRLVAGIANPLVLPSIFLSTVFEWTSGRETAVRALGANTAQYTSWNLSPLALKLHFPARSVSDPTSPAFAKDASGEFVYVRNREALVVLEQAFTAIELGDPDEDRTLALLGIALHVLQDSFKHATYCGARGHIGVHPSPDDVGNDPGLAFEIGEATYLSLRHARLHMLRRESPAAPCWKELLLSAYVLPGEGEPGSARRWRAAVRSTFGDEPGPWEETRATWVENGGPEQFERALEKVRRVLR